jgi:hypothetical protein
LLLTPNNQDIFVHTRTDELVTHTHGINKATALVSDVQGSDFLHFHGTLNQHTAAGKIVIRTQGGEDDEINILRGYACPFDGDFSCFNSHGGGGFFRAVCIAALLNACPLLYPCITCFHVLQQIVICYDLFRQVFADSGDFCFGHGGIVVGK